MAESELVLYFLKNVSIYDDARAGDLVVAGLVVAGFVADCFEVEVVAVCALAENATQVMIVVIKSVFLKRALVMNAFISWLFKAKLANRSDKINTGDNL